MDSLRKPEWSMQLTKAKTKAEKNVERNIKE